MTTRPWERQMKGPVRRVSLIPLQVDRDRLISTEEEEERNASTLLLARHVCLMSKDRSLPNPPTLITNSSDDGSIMYQACIKD